MKKLIAALILAVCAAAPAQARSPRAQVDTQEFAVEICTSAAVSIHATAGGAVNVSTTSVSLSSATFIEVYNADSSASVYCGYESNVSTDIYKAQYGRPITAGIGLGLQINLDKFSGYYCLNSGSGNTRAVITKCR